MEEASLKVNQSLANGSQLPRGASELTVTLVTHQAQIGRVTSSSKEYQIISSSNSLNSSNRLLLQVNGSHQLSSRCPKETRLKPKKSAPTDKTAISSSKEIARSTTFASLAKNATEPKTTNVT